jgi:hypothetical protein
VASGIDRKPHTQGKWSAMTEDEPGKCEKPWLALPATGGDFCANRGSLTIINSSTLKRIRVKLPRMTPYRIHIERLALSILDSKGIEAIWHLHLDAAYAHRMGYPAAAAILELAEAAERELMRREYAPVPIGGWQS